MQLYPGWSARDNYATHNKKKKRKREPQGDMNGGVDSYDRTTTEPQSEKIATKQDSSLNTSCLLLLSED